MGETMSDGIMNNTMSKITDKDRVGNLTKTIGSSQGSAGDPFGATGDLLATINRSATKTAAQILAETAKSSHGMDSKLMKSSTLRK